LRIAGSECAPENAAHVATLQKREIERELRNPRREADHEEAALPGNGPQRSLAIVAANGIEDHIGTDRSDRILEQAGERLLPVAVERTSRIDNRRVRSGVAG